MATAALFSILLLMLPHLAATQNFTASTCVSPSGYNSCMTPVGNYYENCVTSAGADQDKQLACSCVYQLGQLNCVMANCWNVVYGCEYQALAVEYGNLCSLVDLPFFPAPDNAPGGCSCNLGYAFYNATLAVVDTPQCLSLDVSRNEGCDCCQSSGILTSLYSICPHTDPNALPGFELYDTLLQTSDPPLSQCSSDLAQYNCVNDLGFPAIGNIPYLSSLPSTTGSSPLSTTSGTVTAPPSGATFAWTGLGSQIFTITAVSAGKGAASSSKSSSSSHASSSAAPGSMASTSASSAGMATGSSSMSASAAASSTAHSSGATTTCAVVRSGLFSVMFAMLWNI